MTSTAEARFQAGTGNRYLKNGKVRCHACAKHKLKAIREREGNPQLTPDECWPEAQCGMPAAEGCYVCKEWHGGGDTGQTKLTVAGTTLLGEHMPTNLARKFQKFVAQSELLDNYEEIAMFQARQAELLERREEMVIGPLGWQAVSDAIDLIRDGEYAPAIMLLKIALKDDSEEAELQKELRETAKLLDQLRRTNIYIEEKQGSMILRDEYLGTLDLIFKTVEVLFKKYLGEDEAYGAITEFLDAIIRVTGSRTLSSRQTVPGQVIPD